MNIPTTTTSDIKRYYDESFLKKENYLNKKFSEGIVEKTITYYNNEKNNIYLFYSNQNQKLNNPIRVTLLNELMNLLNAEYTNIEINTYIATKNKYPDVAILFDDIIARPISDNEKLILMRELFKNLINNDKISYRFYYNTVNDNVEKYIKIRSKLMRDFLTQTEVNTFDENIKQEDREFIRKLREDEKPFVKKLEDDTKKNREESDERIKQSKLNYNNFYNDWISRGFNIIESKLNKAKNDELTSRSNTINITDSETRRQISEENKLGSTAQSCPSDQYKKDVHDRLQTLNINKIIDLYDNYFYSQQLMQSLSCMLQSMNTTSRRLPNYERMRRYLTHLKIITLSSAGGNPMWGTLGLDGLVKNELFVIKTPKNKDDFDEAIHEYLVGFLCLNNLRTLIPNFAYIFSLFKCGGVVSKGKEVLAWCGGRNSPVEYPYVVYENITHSITMEEFCATCTTDMFMNVFMQVIYSLKIANEKYDFTHYDLHAQNVLVRTINNVSIKYDTDVYLNTNRIGTIIDYGRSHVKYNGSDFGVIAMGNMYEYIYRDTSNIITDVHRFLFACLLSLNLTNNTAVYEKMKYLFLYFHKSESPDNALAKYKNYGGYIPIIMKIKFNMNDFIKYCKDYCDLMSIKYPFTDKPIYQLLQCDGICGSFDEAMSIIGLNPKGPLPIADTLVLFYDTYQFVDDTDKYIKEFYENDLLNAISYEEKYIDSLTNKFKTIQNYSLKSLNTISGYNVNNIWTDLFISAKFLDIYDLYDLSKATTDFAKRKLEGYIKSNNVNQNNFNILLDLYKLYDLSYVKIYSLVKKYIEKGYILFVSSSPSQDVYSLATKIGAVEYNRLVYMFDTLYHGY